MTENASAIAEHRAKIEELKTIQAANEAGSSHDKEQQREWIAFALQMEEFYLGVAEL